LEEALTKFHRYKPTRYWAVKELRFKTCLYFNKPALGSFFLVYEQVGKQFEGQRELETKPILGRQAFVLSRCFEYSNGQYLILKAATSQLIANDALNLAY